MCEFSGRLIAWMDGELAEREGESAEQHLASCTECRARLSSYREASDAFRVYCGSAVDAVIERPRHSNVRRWALGAAVAAVVLLAVALARHATIPRAATIHHVAARAVTSPGNVPRTTDGSGETVLSSSVSTRRHSPIKPVRRARALAEGVKQQSARPASADPAESVALVPAIEIAVPADGMFQPGAMPEGMSFVADVTIAAGEPGARGELTGFERRK